MTIRSRRRNRRMRNWIDHTLPAIILAGAMGTLMYVVGVWFYRAAQWDCANGFGSLFCVLVQ